MVVGPAEQADPLNFRHASRGFRFGAVGNPRARPRARDGPLFVRSAAKTARCLRQRLPGPLARFGNRSVKALGVFRARANSRDARTSADAFLTAAKLARC